MDKIRGWFRKITERSGKYVGTRSIQMTIALSFTVVSVCCLCFLGVLLYKQFSRKEETLMQENSRQLLEQTTINLEDYLRSMRRISDAMYYSVIKDKDLENENLDEEMTLLYEANKDNLVSIACYTYDGRLVEAAPVANEKQDAAVTSQEWFEDAKNQLENFHFSTPHVQNLFDDLTYRYYWVVSLSRTVDLTYGGTSMLGVLLVDMNYSSIERILDKANMSTVSSEYVYLMDTDGEIIYHPKQELIRMGEYEENNLSAITAEEESWVESFGGQKRIVTQRPISYTGWKLVSVVPLESFEMGRNSTGYLAMMLVSLALLTTVILNQFVSARIAKPLRRLNDSVREWETGNLKPDIYVGGSLEVVHLGRTLRSTVRQIQDLMQDIVVKQEEKRKSELDALQSQINPHFLYNTLDSIIWMAEGKKNEEVVLMTASLARLLRQSISNEDEVVPIINEVEYAKSYLTIQKMRYKDKLEFQIDVDSSILYIPLIKLVLQPVIENAIYHGLKYKESKGLLIIKGFMKDGNAVLQVIDDGVGMDEETLAHIYDKHKVNYHSNGVGVYNVQKRLKLYYGDDYGITYESKKGEGTTATITIPGSQEAI